MSHVAARDLRNHTRDVLRRVEQGDTVTITVNGVPVANLTPHVSQRPTAMTRAQFVALTQSQRHDPTLRGDLLWISRGDTGDLGPIA